jgi:putative zinc finger protein
MNCDTVRDVLPLYLSGELRGADLADLQEHLLQCRQCAMAANADRELDDALRTAMLEETPDLSAVLSRVHEHMAAPWWARMSHLFLPRVAVAVGIIIAVVLISVPGIYLQQSRTNLALAAAGDHYSDLVLQRHPDWEHTPEEVARFLQQQFPQKQGLLHAITPQGASFEKVRLCNVAGRTYAHFVFRTGTAETSVFLRPLSQGPARYPAARLSDKEHGLEVAGFSSPGLIGMVVAPQGVTSTREIADHLAKTL